MSIKEENLIQYSGTIKAGQRLTKVGDTFMPVGVGGAFEPLVDFEETTATAGDLLEGKTAYSNNEKISGTIPVKYSQIYTPGTVDQTIASGQYLGGIQTIKGDSALNAGNIASGQTIFGVTGTYVGSGGGGGGGGGTDTTAFESSALAIIGTYVEPPTSSGGSSGGSDDKSGIIVYNMNGEYLSSYSSLSGVSIIENRLDVYRGGVIQDATLSGTFVCCYDSGVVNSVVLTSGSSVRDASIYIDSGGVVSSAQIDAGSIHVSAGGKLYDAKASSSTIIVLLAGNAYASQIAVSSGGYLTVSSGATAEYVTVRSDGHLEVRPGGTASYVTSHYGADIAVDSGGTITYA